MKRSDAEPHVGVRRFHGFTGANGGIVQQGNPGVETPCGEISSAAQYDREYLYEAAGSAAGGYALQPVVKV